MNFSIKHICLLTALLLCSVLPLTAQTTAETTPVGTHRGASASDDAAAPLNPKEIIFEHLGDGYGWEVPFNHHHRIPLPVIVKGTKGWKVFSSARLSQEGGYQAPDGSIFQIAGRDSQYHGKVVEMVDGKEVRPTDISITKNVCGLFIAVLVSCLCIFAVVRWHRRHGFKAPRKGVGAVEAVITWLYDGVIKSTLGDKARKFAPYLLTVFFFILTMNLLGLIVIFPGGANLTGNIAVTAVLAICTFIITNVFATKHYWKEILWPDVPLWLKFPLPIMPVIEIFGMFTKPASLTVRLFANMMGGHMIVIVLTLLIFIFAAMHPVAGGATTVLSIAFSLFMLLIDVLVSFIQAYVFTMLSTVFIGLAQEKEEKKEKDKAKAPETQPSTTNA